MWPVTLATATAGEMPRKIKQRRHQEAAADAEHAGYESDREPHRQNDEDVDRQVCDRKVDLHRRGPRLEAPILAEPVAPAVRKAERVSTEFAARPANGRLTKSRQEPAAPTCD